MGSTSGKHCCENNPKLNPVLKDLLAKHKNLYKKLQDLGLTEAKTLVGLDQEEVESKLKQLFNCDNVAQLLKNANAIPNCVSIPRVDNVKMNIDMQQNDEQKALYIVSVLLQKFLKDVRNTNKLK